MNTVDSEPMRSDETDKTSEGNQGQKAAKKPRWYSSALEPRVEPLLNTFVALYERERRGAPPTAEEWRQYYFACLSKGINGAMKSDTVLSGRALPKFDRAAADSFRRNAHIWPPEPERYISSIGVSYALSRLVKTRGEIDAEELAIEVANYLYSHDEIKGYIVTDPFSLNNSWLLDVDEASLAYAEIACDVYQPEIAELTSVNAKKMNAASQSTQRKKSDQKLLHWLKWRKAHPGIERLPIAREAEAYGVSAREMRYLRDLLAKRLEEMERSLGEG